MEPKDKAVILHTIMYGEMASGITWKQAKQCALIAVDELIDTCQKIKKLYHDNNMINSDIDYQPEEYWQEVKQEIEKL
jgi:hypothetical protein